MKLRNIPTIAVVAFCAFLVPQNVLAGFGIASQSYHQDVHARQTTFTLTFNQTPDFQTVRSVQGNDDGVLLNSFQYEYSSEPAGDFDLDHSSIIRGDEIRFYSDSQIPVRSALGEETPHSGGWGPIRGVAPITVNDKTLTFTVPWSVLGEDDGFFQYRVFTTVDGATSSSAVSVVPLPPAVLAALPTSVLMLVAMYRFRRSHARPR